MISPDLSSSELAVGLRKRLRYKSTLPNTSTNFTSTTEPKHSNDRSSLPFQSYQSGWTKPSKYLQLRSSMSSSCKEGRLKQRGYRWNYWWTTCVGEESEVSPYLKTSGSFCVHIPTTLCPMLPPVAPSAKAWTLSGTRQRPPDLWSWGVVLC